jgi:hypothetical protein
LFLCKRARPNIHTAISVLCTWVKAPTESDWERLIRLVIWLTRPRREMWELFTVPQVRWLQIA